MSEQLHPWLAFDVERVLRVTTQFTKATVGQAHAKGITLGLSGGLDSAVVAALGCQALGAEAVEVVFLPGTSTRDEDRQVARAVADHLGLAWHEVDVAPAVRAMAAALELPDGSVTSANLQPRLRMAALYARAAAQGSLVAGTSNKSELLTGYFTKHGVGGCDLLAIGDLYKTQVRALARKLALPEVVIERPPTAGLWPGQTDEAELGLAYDALDLVLAGFERQAPTARIAEVAGVADQEVDRVRSMVARTWHKRNATPIAKVGWRTVGIDWREPTQSG